MRTKSLPFLCIVLALGLAGATETPVTESTAESLDQPTPKVAEFHRPVLELIEAERQDVATLSAQLEAATDLQEIVRLERAIAARRERLQVEILELRHEQALAAGHAELAAQIRLQIEQFVNPQPAPQKTDRVPRERAH